MSITRRNVLLGATAVAALAPIAARAETSEVAIGVIYPFSGASAQIGVDAQKAFETAAEIINNKYDFDLPLARTEGLPGLGGARGIPARRALLRPIAIACSGDRAPCFPCLTCSISS